MKKAIYSTSILLISSVHAFTTMNTCKPVQSSLNAVNDNNGNSEVSQRRTFLRNIAGVAFGSGAGMMSNQKPAFASYSAYTNREKDWQERKSKGGEFLK